MYGVDMSRPGAQDYYDSMLKLYAGWGVDYIKADDIAAALCTREEIAALHRAIQKTGRPIVLSLSPGPGDGEGHRILCGRTPTCGASPTISGTIGGPLRQFRPDVDLEPATRSPAPGRTPTCCRSAASGFAPSAARARTTRFTRDEQRTLISLWSIAAVAADVRRRLAEQRRFHAFLLTNDEVLAVDQKPARSRQLFQRGDQIAWTSDAAAPNTRYLAVFNVGDQAPLDIRVNWAELGLPATCAVRNLWEKKDLGTVENGYTFKIPPHGSGLYRVW